MGGNKGSALAVLLVVALSFFAGQSSARSWIDFPSLIQGGAAAESADELCKDCDCSFLTGGCACYDIFDSCPSFCSDCRCSWEMGACTCSYVDKKWCAPPTVQKN